MHELQDVPFDYVVTVCDHAHKSRPLFFGQTKIARVCCDDPPQLTRSTGTEAEALRHYRPVRDEIRSFAERLPEALELAEP
jgi:arsenate reductase